MTVDPAATPSDETPCELSVVMPCLNEADTIEECILKAQRAMDRHGIRGEVVIADNGSTDESAAIARRLGARVVPVPERGYGRALAGGFAAARGRFLMMGDADGSYDWDALPAFVDKLREGFDIVQGCRLPAGGGRVMPGAMPWSHRWLGNPVLTWLVRRMFSLPIHDVYCGLRGLTAGLFRRLNLSCGGMEFATEMLIKARFAGASIAEIPITLHPDGRVSHPPHLRTLRDGWRTLRFFMILSPRWLLLYPGLALLALGLAGYALGMPDWTIKGVNFDAHTLLVASLAVLVGFQAIVLALFARLVADFIGVLPPSRLAKRLSSNLSLERGLIAGLAVALAGGALLLVAVNEWRLTGFGNLEYAHTMRWVIPGVTLAALGVQTTLASFLVGLLHVARP